MGQSSVTLRCPQLGRTQQLLICLSMVHRQLKVSWGFRGIWMFRWQLALGGVCSLLAACGGGGEGSPPPSAAPAPTPTPVPTPSPTPTPTPSGTGQGPATVSFLHVFGISPTDGWHPLQPLMQAADGNLYGVASGGGNTCSQIASCGAVIKVTPAGQVSVLHAFRGHPIDGETPSGPLIEGRDGALYGTTYTGGKHNRGTVFRLTLSGHHTVVYSFGPDFADGYHPQGRLLEAQDGNLYGAASGGPNYCPGGGKECGMIFRLSPAGVMTVIHNFRNAPNEGAMPNGSLSEGSDGAFYGTTVGGGNYGCSPNPGLSGCGTVFRITPSGTVQFLHSFGANSSDGIQPFGALLRGVDGAFYGTTRHGGGGTCNYTSSCGTVFKISPSGSLSIVYAFSRPANGPAFARRDGFAPAPFLTMGTDGLLYGVTEDGGLHEGVQNGTIFRLSLSGVKEILYNFGPFSENPHQPTGGLVQGRDGAFYGMTYFNGKLGQSGARTGLGTVYKMTLP